MAGEKKLSALAVKNAAPGVHADGGSLYLSVSKSGCRRWLYRYRSGARVKDLGLGDATVVSLADARTLRDRWRKELALGRDPIETRQVEKVTGITFGEVAVRVLESPRIKSLSNEKHRDQRSYSLKTLAEPLRSRPVADIATGDVLAVLKPQWASGKHETASRQRSRVERVIEVARSEGAIPDDKPSDMAVVAQEEAFDLVFVEGVEDYETRSSVGADVGWIGPPLAVVIGDRRLSPKVGSSADDPCLDIVRAIISPYAATETVHSGGGRPTRPIGAFRAINVTAPRSHRLCEAPAIRRVGCPCYMQAPRRPYRSSYRGRVYWNKGRVGAEIDNSTAPRRAVAGRGE
jgi:Arm DNA-binding domain